MGGAAFSISRGDPAGENGMTGNIRDRIIEQAKSLPDLISKAETFDPRLAKILTGKALVASKSVWGTPVTAGISWAASYYGLGWDAEACALVSGAMVVAASAALRYVTVGPVTGILRAGAICEPPT
jgi:hypothetical protein